MRDQENIVAELEWEGARASSNNQGGNRSKNRRNSLTHMKRLFEYYYFDFSRAYRR